MLMSFYCGKFQFDLKRPLVMGIVNVTPDSFSDGGRHVSLQAALDHARQLVADGADMLDIGGESTRPGASRVSEQEELARVLPLIEALRDSAVPVSIDTYKPAVMQAALAAGASMVNDINALLQERAIEVVAASKAAVCLMHKRGTPQTMQQQAHYEDVVREVADFLRERIVAAELSGIGRERIVIDPGFGFGKTQAHNFTLLQNCGVFAELGVPVLVGMSRKSMIGAATGRDVDGRMAGSVAAAVLAVQSGASIVRVHDVRETVDALKILQAVKEA